MWLRFPRGKVPLTIVILGDGEYSSWIKGMSGMSLTGI